MSPTPFSPRNDHLNLPCHDPTRSTRNGLAGRGDDDPVGGGEGSGVELALVGKGSDVLR
jgi:hypothetical protein